MKGIKFLKPCSFPVHESETDEGGTEENFKPGDLAEADIISEDKKKNTVDLQFGDGSVGFNIPRELFEIVDMPLGKKKR